jgi:selenide,water dikinase
MAEFARRPMLGWTISLVTPSPMQIYSGMLPGWIAGHYGLEECSIDLRTWAAADIELHPGECLQVDLAHRRVRTSAQSELAFDALSIDVGSVPDPRLAVRAEGYVSPMRPLSRLVDSWRDVMREAASWRDRMDLVIVGGGAAGVELALAARYRAMREGWPHLHVTLTGARPEPWSAAPPGARWSVQKLLARRGIGWQGGRLATRVEEGHVHFESGEPLHFDACWLATGPAAPAWPAASGLATDAQGFIRVGPTLECLGQPGIFAAGDIATLADARPRSGVYAVRAGPVLARNLRAYCEGTPLVPWRPQPKALYLIGTGDRSAIGVRGDRWWQGRWAWWWKDRIDRRFVGRYRR